MQDLSHVMMVIEVKENPMPTEKKNIDFSNLSRLNKNKLLTGAIIPRPIAWVTSLNENNSVNLAPFSFFSVVANDVFSISFTQKKSGGKDTLRNILRTKEAVVNTASIPLLHEINESSDESIPYGVSELELLGLSITPSSTINTPMLKEAAISFETRLIQHIPLTYEDGSAKSDIVLLQVVGAHVQPELYNEEKHYIDGTALQPASRLAGKLFGETVVNQDIKRK